MTVTEHPLLYGGFPGLGTSPKLTRRTLIVSGGLLLAFRAATLHGSTRAGFGSLGSPLLASVNPQEPLCLASSPSSYSPQLEKFIAMLNPASDVFRCEQYAAQIQEVLDLLSARLRESPNNLEAIRGHLSPEMTASSLFPSEIVPVRTEGPLRIERRAFHGREIRRRDEFIASWAAYVAPWAKLQTVELQIYGIRETDEAPLSIETDLRCDIVGTAHDDSREQRVGEWHLSWIRDEQDRWILKRWLMGPEIRSKLSGPGFLEVTGLCLDGDGPGMAQLMPGIDDWRSVLDGASGIDVYGNHGIAVADIDGNGFDSFYVCQPSGLPNRLYQNRGDGTFEDITERSGTGILDGTCSALFADFQNRGVQDLLVVRTGGPMLFANMGKGRFEPRPDAFRFARVPQGTFTSAAVADYNCDGYLDVYLCVYSYYQGLNQYQFPSPYYDAQNGPPNFLFRNRGDGTFEDVTVSSGIDENNNRFSFAAAWCDYDSDGWPDLYVANDFGRKNLYRNNRDGTFTDVAAKTGVEDYGPGMSTCWFDHDNDGLQDVYVANMWLPEGQRITADERFLPGVDPTVRALYRKHNAGNSLYRNRGTGSFEDKTISAGTAMGRWSWSCAAWDFDNDGWDDIYVANGFVSGPKNVDLQSFFWRQVAQRSLTPTGVSPEYEMAWNAVNELVRSDYSWSGYQRNVFFANNHDGTFSDVSGALGLDLVDDCRAYALSDFDHDGRLEFVLKNRSGPQLRVLRNNLEGIGDSIVFRLAGRKSNRDAIGATVTIESGATRQTKFVSAGSGFASQHTKELFFGLGRAPGMISISVRWPTGEIARYDKLPPNHRIEIEEGEPSFKATPYQASQWRGHASATIHSPKQTPETVSTWLIAPLFGPEIELPDVNGEMQSLSSLRGRPVLLTFVRTDCGNSVVQLENLQKAVAELAATGLSLYVVALSERGDRAAIADLIRAKGLTIPIHPADDRAVGPWNVLYRYLYDRRREMAFPLSFLLDASGAIIRLYRGVASPQDVIRDWQSAPSTSVERFAHALPYPGPYYGGPMEHDYLTYGVAFVEYGFLDEAQAAFQRVIDSDPNQESAWFNLGTIYLNRKMYPEAHKCLSEAARLNPQDADAWNNLGMIAGEQQKYDEALDDFRRAAFANPRHLVAVENMMRIYRFQGRAADAQKTLEELIAQAPDNADLHLGLAMTLVAQNDLVAARRELETSIQLKPKNPEAMNNLGAVLLRLGLAQDALAQFEQSMRLAPDFDRPHINAALVYRSAGQPEQARKVLADFLARHPDDADVRTALDKLGTP